MSNLKSAVIRPVTPAAGAMKHHFNQLFRLLSSLCLVTLACSNRRESLESTPPDFTGFWKWNCSQDWGVQIKKQPGNLFSVSFCGPGGCFEPGQWMPNTPIVGDPRYRYIHSTTLAIEHGDGWQTPTKCTTNPNPVLADSTVPTESSGTKQLGTSLVAELTI
jgi:hypothetical protein